MLKHKKLIKDLLNITTEKREEVYLLTSKMEILKRECNFWIYDFENIRKNKEIRERFSKLDTQEIARTVYDEMSHKVTILKEEKSLVVNSDIFRIVSGQGSYFFEQKKLYLSEIDRLKEIIVATEKERTKYRDDYYFTYNELNLLKVRYDKEVEILRKKVNIISLILIY